MAFTQTFGLNAGSPEGSTQALVFGFELLTGKAFQNAALTKNGTSGNSTTQSATKHRTGGCMIQHVSSEVRERLTSFEGFA